MNEHYLDEISLEERKKVYDKKVTEGILTIFDKGYVVNNAKFYVIKEESTLGEGSIVGEECLFSGSIKVGKNCMFGYRSMVLAQEHVFWNPPEKPFCTQGAIIKPIVIGDDVWIGAYAVITGGVKIGNHVIIGAGAIVTHNVPDWEIWVGNPAHKIGDRRTWKKF